MRLDIAEKLSVDMEFAPTWAPGPPPPGPSAETRPDWRTVDRALRQIAARRAALDAEEVRWLREAEALQIWRPLGMVSALVGRPSKLDAAILRTQAKAALTGLGWKPAIAHAAVASAVVASQCAELTLEQLIRESLRRCPRPKA